MATVQGLEWQDRLLLVILCGAAAGKEGGVGDGKVLFLLCKNSAVLEIVCFTILYFSTI